MEKKLALILVIPFVLLFIRPVLASNFDVQVYFTNHVTPSYIGFTFASNCGDDVLSLSLRYVLPNGTEIEPFYMYPGTTYKCSSHPIDYIYFGFFNDFSEYDGGTLNINITDTNTSKTYNYSHEILLSHVPDINVVNITNFDSTHGKICFNYSVINPDNSYGYQVSSSSGSNAGTIFSIAELLSYNGKSSGVICSNYTFNGTQLYLYQFDNEDHYYDSLTDTDVKTVFRNHGFFLTQPVSRLIGDLLFNFNQFSNFKEMCSLEDNYSTCYHDYFVTNDFPLTYVYYSGLYNLSKDVSDTINVTNVGNYKYNISLKGYYRFYVNDLCLRTVNASNFDYALVNGEVADGYVNGEDVCLKNVRLVGPEVFGGYNEIYGQKNNTIEFYFTASAPPSPPSQPTTGHFFVFPEGASLAVAMVLGGILFFIGIYIKGKYGKGEISADLMSYFFGIILVFAFFYAVYLLVQNDSYMGVYGFPIFLSVIFGGIGFIVYIYFTRYVHKR